MICGDVPDNPWHLLIFKNRTPSPVNTLNSRDNPDFGLVNRLFIAALVRPCLLVGLPSTGGAAIYHWNDGCGEQMFKVRTVSSAV
jgi:hypothetical protein